ncbi:MAG: SEL1-like repeat protein, partial [Acidobacteria bacterium]|nr:SEL1-like repeat protein [Acidobacteriota bacterium]
MKTHESRSWVARALARRVVGLIILATCLAPSLGLAQEPGQGQELSLEEALARSTEQSDELRAKVAADAKDSDAWRALLMIEPFRVVQQLLVQDPNATREARNDAGKRVVAQVLAAWIAADPSAAGPWLIQAGRELEGDARDDFVLGLPARFPDDPAAFEAAERVLRARGEAQKAGEMLEGFARRHPDLPGAYQLVFRHFQDQGNTPRAQEWLDRWLARWPGSGEALDAWLSSQEAQRDPEAMRPALEQFLASAPEDPKTLGFCTRLVSEASGAYRPEARRCLRALSEGNDPDLARQAAEQLVRAAGLDQDWETARWAAARLPQEERGIRLLRALNATRDLETCPERLAVARQVVAHLDQSSAGYEVSVAYGACSAYAGADEVLAAMLEGAPPEELAQAVSTLHEGSGRAGDGAPPAGVVIPILERRLAADPDRYELWRALDEAYAAAGAEDARLAHLKQWIAQLPDGTWVQPYTELAALLVGRGDLDGAAAVLEGAPKQMLTRPEITSALLGVYLLAGKTDQIQALGRRLLETSGEGGGALGHLTLARAAWATGSRDEALRQYRAYFEAAGSSQREDREYLQLVAEGGAIGEVVAAVEELCVRPGRSGHDGGAEECAADHLDNLGLSYDAVPYLAAAAERTPENRRLLERLALTAQRGGESEAADQAVERLLELDPKSEQTWAIAAENAYHRHDVEELRQVLANSQRALGEPIERGLFLLGRLYREQGEPRRALEVLEQLRAVHPDYYWLDAEIRDANTALGAQVAATPPALAPVRESAAEAGREAPAPVTQAARPEPGSAAELLAEADALYAGLGGHFDLGAARELFKKAAATGDPMATLRLAGLYHLGNCGFSVDRRLGDRMAREALPAVRELATGGDDQAQYLLGLSYLVGIGCEADARQAKRWFEASVAQDNPFAPYNLAWMYREGVGVGQDRDAAARWYQRAADLGHGDALYSLAQLELGSGDAAVLRRGVEAMRRVAEMGKPDAMQVVGNVLLYGRQAVEADPSQARPWLEKAVAAGNRPAVFDLAWALLTEPTPSVADLERTASLLDGIAEENPQAKMLLGWSMVAGLLPGTSEEGSLLIEEVRERGADGFQALPWVADGDRGRALLARGARALTGRAGAGDPDAAALLASQYFLGWGVPYDPARAVELATRAAEGGSASAMRYLGHAYFVGEGVPTDKRAGAEWWRRGADRGESFCMMFLSQALR